MYVHELHLYQKGIGNTMCEQRHLLMHSANLGYNTGGNSMWKYDRMAIEWQYMAIYMYNIN